MDNDARIFHLNAASLKLLRTERDAVLMKRGGEVLHCVHSREAVEKCKRARHCRDCVVRNSVAKVFRGEKIQRALTKMTLLVDGRSAEIDLSITASRLTYEGRGFALLILEDATQLKKTEGTHPKG